jgi:ubiquinone/menaquinone biosynthesis C-methylase UbiE
MIEYARAQAKAEQMSERVEFRVMDALHMLEFLADSFDLVNQHFALSWVRTWDWPKLLAEYQRVAHPGGVVRMVGGDWTGETSSPALARLSDIWQEAFYQAGYTFTPKSDGAMSQLPSLLVRHGLENVQSRAFTLEYRAGTPEWQDYYKDMELFLRTGQPFLRKWIRLPEDYENICQQALSEMQQPDFVAKLHMLTVWGNVTRR